MLTQQDGYKDATESRDPSIQDEYSLEYMKGYREGLLAQLEWAKQGIHGFDRDFPHVK